MSVANPPTTPRVAVVPQLARPDWMYYALSAGRIACGLWLLAFLWYGWGAFGDFRTISSAVPPAGAAPDAFVRLEGAFSAGDQARATVGVGSEAILIEGLDKDCGLSSFWHARVIMYWVSDRSDLFHERITNLEANLARPFSVTPADGKPVEVVGVPTKMYGTRFVHRSDPPFLIGQFKAGPNIDVIALTASSGCVLGRLEKGGTPGQDRIVPHPELGFVFSGIPGSTLSRHLLLRVVAHLLTMAVLLMAARRIQLHTCLDRALERPSQFCVFEATGGSEMVGMIGIGMGIMTSLMLVSPPPVVDEQLVPLLHGAIALTLAGVVLGASRVEFFYVANKADGMLYAVSRGLWSSDITRVMNLQEFKPRVRFEDTDSSNGTKTSYYIETSTPEGGTLYVSDSYRDSIGPAEMLSEYERFEKTGMTEPPLAIHRLVG